MTAPVDAQQPTLPAPEVNSSDRQPCVVVRGLVPAAKPVQLRRPLRLMEALFLAGGLTEGAGEIVRVVHSSPEIRCPKIPTWDWKLNEEKAQSYSIAALKRDEEKANPYLRAGDIVDVSEVDRIYVVGNVVAPQAIYLREPLTLTRAIAMVGGELRDSRIERVRIVRQVAGSPTKLNIFVDLKAIRNHGATDLVLQANDIIDVPEKHGRRDGRVPTRLIP